MSSNCHRIGCPQSLQRSFSEGLVINAPTVALITVASEHGYNSKSIKWTFSDRHADVINIWRQTYNCDIFLCFCVMYNVCAIPKAVSKSLWHWQWWTWTVLYLYLWFNYCHMYIQMQTLQTCIAPLVICVLWDRVLLPQGILMQPSTMSSVYIFARAISIHSLWLSDSKWWY